MDLATDLAFAGRTSIYKLVSKPNEDLDLAREEAQQVANTSSSALLSPGGAGGAAGAAGAAGLGIGLGLASPSAGAAAGGAAGGAAAGDGSGGGGTFIPRASGAGGSTTAASPLLRSNSRLSITQSGRRYGSMELSANLSPIQQLWAGLCCFVAGIGVPVPFAVLLSASMYFSQVAASIGAGTFSYMISAYYLSCLVALTLQRAFLTAPPTLTGITRALILRFAIAMGGTAACLIALPPSTGVTVIVLTGLLGLMQSLTLSSASLMLQLLPYENVGVFFVGSSIGTIIIIGITYGLGFVDPTLAETVVWHVFITAAVLVLLALAALILLVTSRFGQHFLRQRGLDVELTGANTYKSDISNAALLRFAWRSHVACVITVFGDTITAIMIPFVPSANSLNIVGDGQFTLVVLYTIMVAQLIGRQFNVTRKRCCSISYGVVILVASILQLIAVIGWVAYTLQAYRKHPHVWISDGFILFLTVIVAMLGSFVQPAAFTECRTQVASSSVHPQAALLLCITSTCSATLGVLIGLASLWGLGAVPV